MEKEKYRYFYGKVCFPDGKLSEGIIKVYLNMGGNEKNPIGSLEGIFESFLPIEDEGTNEDWECNVNRLDMVEFENKYNGKFIPFRKLD